MSYMIHIYEYKALWIYQDTNRTSCSQVAIFKSLQLQTFTICSQAAIAWALHSIPKCHLWHRFWANVSWNNYCCHIHEISCDCNISTSLISNISWHPQKADDRSWSCWWGCFAKFIKFSDLVVIQRWPCQFRIWALGQRSWQLSARARNTTGSFGGWSNTHSPSRSSPDNMTVELRR